MQQKQLHATIIAVSLIAVGGEPGSGHQEMPRSKLIWLSAEEAAVAAVTDAGWDLGCGA